jgi:hypothetical protein
MEQEQAKFEGWAVLEMMGHRKEIGFVTTEYFGGAALLRCDTPEMPDREFTLKRPEWMDVEGKYREVPAGSAMQRKGTPAKTVYVAPGSLYAMTPVSEDTARRAIEEMVRREVIVLHINEEKPALPAPTDDDQEDAPTICDACREGDHDNCINTQVDEEDALCECTECN